jgi:metal-responsive CopG/Arc/MetJ family transcriptional regulator
MKSVTTHITIPEELLKEMDEQARREHLDRSEILREAIRRYLGAQRRENLQEQRIRRVLQGLEESAGSWKDEAHPELKELGDVRSLRKDLWKRDQDNLESRS